MQVEVCEMLANQFWWAWLLQFQRFNTFFTFLQIILVKFPFQTMDSNNYTNNTKNIESAQKFEPAVFSVA